MAQAAYEKKVEVSINGTTWETAPATTSSMELGGEVLDSTLLGSAGYRSRILGLHDWSVTMDCNWASGNAALEHIRAAKINRTTLHARYLPDGNTSSGYKGQVVVESFNLAGEVSALETVSITLQGHGAISAA